MAAAAVPGATSEQRRIEVVIVGAGFGGIAAAIELRRRGIEHVRILERGRDYGGTWFHNSYPGCACDVPSHLYSFSYAQRRDWSRLCSPQAEINSYLHHVAREHGIERLIQTDTTVTSSRWEEEIGRWRVETADGSAYEADAIVLATGQLDEPSIPELPGAHEFAGHSFHSARWDHGYDLRGKRVAVIGTGASAVQFVPRIAPECARLDVFQRTGNWFLPRKNRAYPRLLRAAIERIPLVQPLRRRYMFEYTEALTLCIRHPRTAGRLLALRSAAFMRSQLKDPDLRARAWPHYTFGCKRILFSSDFLTTLERENVALVSEPIERLEPAGIRTADGTLHELDCVIWATGFHTTDFVRGVEVRGAGGVELHERWAGAPHAHLGMVVPSFPSMFMMYGPNTNTSGGSIIVYLEAQAGYIADALVRVRARDAAALEVREEVEAASDRALQQRFAGTAWLDCDSWYRDEHGRIVTNWPGYMREYVEQARAIDERDYHFIPQRERVTAAESS
jgi:cation diffusion facilitator CzcD-associated flavoprotein CzcO